MHAKLNRVWKEIANFWVWLRIVFGVMANLKFYNASVFQIIKGDKH